MCETGTDSLNTLAICLAVIIPVVVAIAVISFFIFKAYRRNKKEAMEDNDPDFNVDNIMLPEYDPNYGYKPHGNMAAVGGHLPSDSTDSFGNPFNEKYANHPSQVQLNPESYNAPDASVYHMTTSANAINLPFGDSKEELDQYSRNLGMDFHEFNYPIKKMNTAGGASRSGSPGHSRNTSFSSPRSRPLTGYGINAPSTQSSPLKNNIRTSNNGDNMGKVKSNLGNFDTTAAFTTHNQKSSVGSTEESLRYHPAGETLDPEENQEEHKQEKRGDDGDGPFSDSQEPKSRIQSLNSSSTGKPLFSSAKREADLRESTPSSTSPMTSSVESDLQKNEESSNTTIANEAEAEAEAKADGTVNLIPQILTDEDYSVQKKESKPIELKEEDHIKDDVPNFKDIAENEAPLSPEEEEQLNRMKSIYQVYFSRDGSIKRKDINPNVNEDNLPPLPAISLSTDEDEKLKKADDSEDKTTENKLSIPQNEGNDDDFRASVSSSVYLPVSAGGLNHSNSNAGQFAHQQLGKIIQNKAVDQSQQQQRQPYPQYQQYPGQHPQQYPQQYLQYGNGYPPNQQQYQQYYQQYPQMYQQYPPQQYGYPANQRAQPYASVPKPLPALEQLPLPHQLNKRTSTLESFTTFTAQSHKNPVTVPAIPIDQKFNPIDHVNWGQTKGSAEGGVPSPSQIRNSISVFNPVGLTNKSNTFVSKGTAKERVRQLQRQQTDGSIPQSPTLSGPLYGFYDNVMERPHGAENLIPKSGSQADLRKYMDNANV